MIGELWTYMAIKPNNNSEKKGRPVLIIGNDEDNGLEFIDINYVIVSSSSPCGKYDVKISEQKAKAIGLDRASVIKTTKIYTGSQTKLGKKIGDLPPEIKQEFKKKYEDYQKNILDNF